MLYGGAILTGAALVFQIQPVAGKLLLPSFGGGASVWTTCMFFFQAMLLAGYGYAHALTRLGSPRQQAALHATLLLLSMLFLPVAVSARPIDTWLQDPAALILLELLLSIGAPFAMLASTAPLIQRWAAMTSPRHSPYRLYALSNFGALLALLSYPLMVEPVLSLRAQTVVWTGAYLLFAVIMLGACWLVWKHHGSATNRVFATGDRHGRQQVLLPLRVPVLTVLLAASGVVILLAVTNEITQNIAPVPFLWILPLVTYLLSYILCFSGEGWYDRAIWGSLFVVSASSLIILHFFGTSFPIVPVIVAYMAAPFIARLLIADAGNVDVELTTRLIRIVFPFLPAISLSALFSGMFIVVLGGLGDRYGRVRLVLFGNILNIVGSLLIAFAIEGALATPMILVGRILQGLSTACIMPAALALLKTHYDGRARQRAEVRPDVQVAHRFPERLANGVRP